MIDFFSCKIISWKILKTVNARNIKDLYSNGLASLNLSLNWPLKPELRVDRGSPNTTHVAKQFFKGIETELIFARVHRPTDNTRAERLYGTIKQEEIYLVGDYQDGETVDEMNNKTELLKQLKCLEIKWWTERKNYW